MLQARRAGSRAWRQENSSHAQEQDRSRTKLDAAKADAADQCARAQQQEQQQEILPSQELEGGVEGVHAEGSQCRRCGPLRNL